MAGPVWGMDELERGAGPLIRLRESPLGAPIGAVGSMRIAAPPDRVWAVVSDVDRFAEIVPMVSKVVREGARVALTLKFKVALFAAKFGFVADVVTTGDRRLELSYVSGEPEGIYLAFEIAPLDDGAASLVRASVTFDVQSLGWLVKFFLRHHPEIQFGIYPGTTLVLLDALRRASEP